jgi:hypothetical protein
VVSEDSKDKDKQAYDDCFLSMSRSPLVLAAPPVYLRITKQTSTTTGPPFWPGKKLKPAAGLHATTKLIVCTSSPGSPVLPDENNACDKTASH